MTPAMPSGSSISAITLGSTTTTPYSARWWKGWMWWTGYWRATSSQTSLLWSAEWRASLRFGAGQVTSMTSEAVPPAVIIRAAQPADAPVLARLRYEFRASEDPVVEPEADFLARCTAWMAAQLAPGGSWRCW